MDVKVEFQNLDKLQKLFENATTSGTMNDLKQAMKGTAEAVLNESKKIVPWDTGTLKDSGRVEDPVVDSNGIEVEISYGGAASKYAGIVHENMNARHKDGTSAKYLEIPVMAAQDTFVKDVMARYARNLRGS